MLVKKVFFILLFMMGAYIANAEEVVASPQLTEPSVAYIAQLDDYYAQKKALFREIFTYGLEKLVAQINLQKPAAKTWGVIFALDNTLVDDSVNHLANPGAVELTCKIQKLGGVVVIVTDRIGNPDIISKTTQNLDEQDICYAGIVFANDKGNNKNPRFVAVTSGDYENVITTKKLPPLQILAYFGSNIEDFPDLKQNLANRLPVSDNMFSQFGQKYFMLPQ